jgi:hypothetical protein
MEPTMRQELLDPEEIEDMVRQIEALPRSLWSPALQAEFEQLVELSARMLLDLREMGLVRIYLDADGYIATEMLDRRLQ